MKILTNNKEIAEALNSWLGVLAVIFAGGYALLEYIEHKQDVKVERSLSYVESYRDGNIADAKLSLNQTLSVHQDSLTQLLSQANQTSEQLNSAYNQFILQISDDQDVQRNIEIAFSFYEEIAICVERKLCDSEVIQSFFINDARALFNAYFPYVCSLRKEWKNDEVYLKLEEYYIRSTHDICALPKS
jgi:hypothetical protein